MLSNSASLQEGEVPLVVGCGAIGLAVIASVESARNRTGDCFGPFSFRRTSAEKMGADVVVDPNAENPMDIWVSNASMGSRMCRC